MFLHLVITTRSVCASTFEVVSLIFFTKTSLTLDISFFCLPVYLVSLVFTKQMICDLAVFYYVQRFSLVIVGKEEARGGGCAR